MKSKNILLVTAVLALTMFTAFSAKADDGDPWILKPVQKISRGIANVAFGVFEIPMKWSDIREDKGNIAGLTYGTLTGVGYFVARVVVGVVDVATFIIPLPGCPDYPDDRGWGYGPIMQPEWVVPVSKDWNNFAYDNHTITSPTP